MEKAGVQKARAGFNLLCIATLTLLVPVYKPALVFLPDEKIPGFISTPLWPYCCIVFIGNGYQPADMDNSVGNILA